MFFVSALYVAVIVNKSFHVAVPAEWPLYANINPAPNLYEAETLLPLEFCSPKS